MGALLHPQLFPPVGLSVDSSPPGLWGSPGQGQKHSLVRCSPTMNQLLGMAENQQGAKQVEDFNTYPSLTAMERESSLVVDIILL